MFKHYIEGAEKSADNEKCNRPANKKLLSYEEVSKFNSFGGILEDDLVDISFDSIEEFDKILDIIESENKKTYCLYSPHGGHTFWKIPDGLKIKNGQDIILACGIKADIHNKGTYIPIKCDGRFRQEVYENKNIIELPKFLYPTDSKQDLFNLSEGKRNSTLSKHAFSLNGMSEEEIKNIFKLINTMVLKKPLSDSELETILRPETMEKLNKASMFGGKKFQHNMFAKYMMDKYKVARCNGQIMIYNDGYFTANPIIMHRKMINEYDEITNHQREETYKYIKAMAQEKEQASSRFILFANGIYDLSRKELLALSDSMIFPNRIKFKYNKNAYSEIVDNTLNRLSCGDSQIRQLLLECAGYCMFRDSKLGKCFVFTGEKNNGKSTFIYMLERMLGDDNTASIDISTLGERFTSSGLHNKLANISDDISDGFVSGLGSSLFKKIATGNRISAEFKGQDKFEFTPYSTMVFSANEMPRIKDPTGAIIKRLLMIPFNAVFTSQDPDFDPFIQEKLCTDESIEYLIKLSIDALIGVLERNGFCESAVVEKETTRYQIDNDSVLSFLEEVERDEIIAKNVQEVYSRYDAFCSDNGFKASSRIIMSKKIKLAYGLLVIRREIAGTKYSIFAEDGS